MPLLAQLHAMALPLRGKGVTANRFHRWVKKRIVANFREKGLERMRPGHPALVALRGRPGRLWPARVLWIGSGVSQGQGVPSGFLPEVKEQTR